jgi:hypothetical protein
MHVSFGNALEGQFTSGATADQSVAWRPESCCSADSRCFFRNVRNVLDASTHFFFVAYFFVFEIRSFCVNQAGLRPLGSKNPLLSVS